MNGILPERAHGRALVAGQWVHALDGSSFEVSDPACGKAVQRVPDMGAPDVRRAILAASHAQAGWSAVPAAERGEVLGEWHRLVADRRDDLAGLIVREQGKVLAEARVEIEHAAAYIQWYSGEAKRIYGDYLPGPDRSRRMFVLKQPIGAVAAITAWNYPAVLVARKLAAAVAAGCTVVLKPAEQTPLTALALAHLAGCAGLPDGVLNVVTCRHPDPVATELSTSPHVRGLTFTGSTDVGRRLAGLAAQSLKRVSLELGGNAPFIVLDDADSEAAARGAIASRFRNAGQSCGAANRFYVHRSICEAFTRRMAELAASLRVGPGDEPGSQIGPLIDAAAAARLAACVEDAVRRGGVIACGGRTTGGRANFFEPTVIANASQDMRCVRNETFGPIAPIVRIEDAAQAVELANDCESGLAGFLYTRDLNRAWRIAESLQCGVVGLNTGVTSNEAAPFGGIKQSGSGREGSRYGLDAFMETKYLCLGGLH